VACYQLFPGFAELVENRTLLVERTQNSDGTIRSRNRPERNLTTGSLYETPGGAAATPYECAEFGAGLGRNVPVPDGRRGLRPEDG
jgi:hypothetical protein